MTKFIAAKLSSPSNDEEKIKNLFQTALEGVCPNPVRSLFFVQPDVVVLLVSEELAKDLVSRTDPVQLGQMTATFESNVYPSNCVEINFNELSIASPTSPLKSMILINLVGKSLMSRWCLKTL